MGWALIGVLNAGIEILLIIGVGYLFSKFKLLEGERFMPQANPLMVMVCFPAFNLYKVGISLQLRDEQAWRDLSAYMLWVAIIQIGIVIYTWAFNHGDIGEAGLLNLLLSANNTVIIGLPIMLATFGDTGVRVSLLTSVALFLQVMPFSIVAFELERWLMVQVQEHLEATKEERSNASKNGGVPPPLPPGVGGSDRQGALHKSQEDAAKTPGLEPRGAEPAPSPGQPAAAFFSRRSAQPSGPENGAASAQGLLHGTGLRHAATVQGLKDVRSSGEAGKSASSAPALASASASAPPAARSLRRSAFLEMQQPLDPAPHVGLELQAMEAGGEEGTRVLGTQRTGSLSLMKREAVDMDSRHFRQIALAHSGRATTITVAELSRAERVQSYAQVIQSNNTLRANLLRQRRHQSNLASVDCPLPMEFAQLQVVPYARMSNFSAEEVQEATNALIQGHGGHIPFYKRFLTQHSQLVHVTTIVLKNPMLWSLMLALIVSVSGLRVFLDPNSPQYVEGLGWVALTLMQLANITVPLALFSNGVWMYGKNLKTSPRKLAFILAMKWTILPLLQMACAKVAQLDTNSAMSLVLLSATPTASTAFVVAAQYGRGTELVTLVTIICTVLLVPVVLMWLYLPGIMGVWTYDLSNLPVGTTT